MVITQELMNFLQEKQFRNIEEATDYLKTFLTEDSNISDYFISESIMSLNSIDDEKFTSLLNDVSDFYFYEYEH